MIEFSDKDGVVGYVQVEDDELVASDPSLERLAEGFDVAEFESFYDGWSNGYVSGRKVPG